MSGAEASLTAADRSHLAEALEDHRDRAGPGGEVPVEDLLDDIIRVAEAVGAWPATSTYDERGTYGRTTVYSTFDSWRAVIAAAAVRRSGGDWQAVFIEADA